MKYTEEAGSQLPTFNDIDKLRYVICPYRFAIESLVQERAIYRERFLNILYFRVILQNAVQIGHAGEAISENELKEIINSEYRNLDDKYHISNEYEKTQIISGIYHFIKEISTKNHRMPTVNYKYSALLDRKNDFLLTDLRDYESAVSEVDLNKVLSDDEYFTHCKSKDCKYCSCKDICLISVDEIVSN